MELYNIDCSEIKEVICKIAENEPLVIDSRGVRKNVLIKINEYISHLHNIKLILICDYTKLVNKDWINNLEVLSFLNNINRLVILNHSSIGLSQLENVKYIKELSEFSLKGFIEQTINIDILLNFDMKKLDLELNATTLIYHLIAKNRNLQSLSMNTIDASKIEKKSNVVSLNIYKELFNPDKLGIAFPDLISLQLFSVRKIKDFAFLSNFVLLENLSIRNTNIEKFPKLGVDKLIRLELLMNKKLKNIESILCFKSLKKLAITGSEIIDVNVLIDCTNIRGLKQFYFASSKTKTKLMVEEQIKKNKIISVFNDFWDI